MIKYSIPLMAHIWSIEWNDAMSVGIPEIDASHRHFVALINDLNQAILEHMELSEIQKRLQLILDDAVQHFAHEEELFRQWKYPDANEHAAKHAQVIAAFQAVKEKFITYGLESEWITAGQEVKDLLIEHLLTEDMKYADYYRKHRAGESSLSPRGEG